MGEHLHMLHITPIHMHNCVKIEGSKFNHAGKKAHKEI